MKRVKDSAALPEKAKAGAAAAIVVRIVLYVIAALVTFFYSLAAFLIMSDDMMQLFSVYSRLTGRDRQEIMYEFFSGSRRPGGLMERYLSGELDFSGFTALYIAVIAVIAVVCAVLYFVSFKAKLKVAEAEKID